MRRISNLLAIFFYTENSPLKFDLSESNFFLLLGNFMRFQNAHLEWITNICQEFLEK